MSIENTIDQKKDSIIDNIGKRRKQKILLYSSGVIAKMNHANYALIVLKELSSQSDVTTTTNEDVYTVSEKLHFYVDSFFAFLYSSFDVIGQIINQKIKLDIDEKRVSIKRIKVEIDKITPVNSLKSILDRIFKSNSFKNLEKYRNCSTHRRQIYIRAETVVIEETPGYTTTGELTRVKRLICDNPLAMTPTVKQGRELVEYCENIYNKVDEYLIQIINNL